MSNFIFNLFVFQKKFYSSGGEGFAIKVIDGFESMENAALNEEISTFTIPDEVWRSLASVTEILSAFNFVVDDKGKSQ